MKLVIWTTLALCLCGCIPYSVIRDRAIGQDVTVADVVDTILVTNIFRARDQAPLHFADIPLMHESFQISGGVTPTILFGPVNPGSTSNTVAPAISVQEAPTFDLSNLDTQDFINGIMSPIKARIVKYWLDRGLDDRIALLLFFSSVTITVGEGDSAQSMVILNNPRTAKRSDGNQNEFSAYLKTINYIKGPIRVVEFPDLTPVGPPFALDTDKHLREMSKIDSDKYEIDPLERNPDQNLAKVKAQPYTLVKEPEIGVTYPRYQLFSVSDKKVLICFDSETTAPLKLEEQKACGRKGGAQGGSEPPALKECQEPKDFASKPCRATLTFALRSAGDVVHFLGDLLWLEETRTPSVRLNNPIKLKYCSPREPNCDDGGTLFEIPRERMVDRGRLRVPYRGDYYTVPNATSEDHTLEVLAITSQLINLNKSEKELRATPTVQIVP